MTSPYPPLQEQFCGNCRFRRAGVCRRHAPRPGFRECWQLLFFPEVAPTDWCGEWAPLEAGEVAP